MAKMRWAVFPLVLSFLAPVFVCQASVRQQLDALVSMAQGKRIGLITNPSGCDESGSLDADYLISCAPATTVTAFFAPEHGLRGVLPPGAGGGDYIDPQTSIPVYAIYGERNAPTDAQFAQIDLLVFDLQDVGVRFYTYVWTMTHCMEAAARNAKTFVVIDRPNPIGGLRVEGAPNTVNYGLIGRLASGATFGVSTRTGMTAGEIAKMWNEEYMSPKVQLEVILVPGWQRSHYWSDCERVFVAPSPNMRTPAAAIVYPGTCLFEGTNLSEGRGSDKPFEYIGAPFINGARYADELTSLGLAGVQFEPVSFTPTTSKWTGQFCAGVELIVTDRDSFDPIRTALFMLQTVWRLYPSSVIINSGVSSRMAVSALESRIKTDTVDNIIAGWQSNLASFRVLRSKYLLYPEGTTAVDEWPIY